MKVLFLMGIVFFISIPAKAQILEDDGRESKIDSLMKVGKLPVTDQSEYLLSGDEGRIKKIPILDSIPYPIIITGSTDTTGRSATKPGDIYIDTNYKRVYISTGSGRGKYILLNFLLPVFIFIRKRLCSKR